MCGWDSFFAYVLFGAVHKSNLEQPVYSFHEIRIQMHIFFLHHVWISCGLYMEGCLAQPVYEGMAVGDPLWIVSILLNPLLLKAYVPVESVFYSFHGPSWYVSVLFGFYIIAYFLLKKLNAIDKKKADRLLGYEVLAVYAVQLIVCLLVDFMQLEQMRLYLAYVNPYFRIMGEGMMGILLCRRMPEIQDVFRTYHRTWIEIITITVFFVDFLVNNFVQSSIYSAWIQVFPMALLLIAFYEDSGVISTWFKKQGGKPF